MKSRLGAPRLGYKSNSVENGVTLHIINHFMRAVNRDGKLCALFTAITTNYIKEKRYGFMSMLHL